MPKRMITTQFTEEDVGVETGLRPKLLDDYIGQKKVKDNLSVYIKAALVRGGTLEYWLAGMELGPWKLRQPRNGHDGSWFVQYLGGLGQGSGCGQSSRYPEHQRHP